MPFTLSRGGPNVVAEVQRWQYFLRRMRIPQTGLIDGSFRMKTETGTKIFQMQAGLPVTGKVNATTLGKAEEHGYTILPDTYYQERAGDAFPAEPDDLSSPSNSFRNDKFTCFKFLQRPRPPRPDREAVIIKGACDGSTSDWEAEMIVDIEVPQLEFAVGYPGRVTCHKRVAEQIAALFKAWQDADLLHLITRYDGCFVPRYKRGQAPHPSNGHGTRKSSDVPELSNHSFGSAFDINADDNPFGERPVFCGERGCTRELVAIANQHGLFWGGHFNTRDGMHFEVARL